MARTKEATELDRQIGMRLRLLRAARGKTQEWLGEQLGLTFQQVQKYEKGINRISGSCMQDIASALGVTPAYFFGDAAAKRDTDVLAEAEIGLLQDHGALALIRAYHAVPAGQRMALRNLAEAMVSAAVQVVESDLSPQHLPIRSHHQIHNRAARLAL